MVHFTRFVSLLIALALPCALLLGQSSNPVGDAFVSGEDCYTITSNTNWQLGAVWFNDPVTFAEDFEISIDVSLGNNPNGADGIVLVFQQVGTNALGESGGGLGFSGFSPSLGIEIDTFTNVDFNDPNFDHISILSNGIVNHASANNLSGPVAAIPGGVSTCDGQFHALKVTWNAQAQVLSVFYDCNLRLTYTGDIVNGIFQGNPSVFWGFTGATGGSSNEQSACISNFAAGLPPEIFVCQGEEVELGVVGAEEGTYSWSPELYLDDPSSATPIAAPEADIIYTVTFTDICGDVTEWSTAVSVIEPVVEIPTLTEACEGESVTISASGNAEEYLWSDGTASASITVTESTEVSITGFLQGCEATAEAEVVFHPVPLTDIEPAYAFCESELFELSVSSDTPSEITWSDGQTGPIFSTTTAGNYSLTLLSENACENTYNFTLSEIALPIPTLAPEAVICEGESLLVQAGEAESYLWSTGEQSQTVTLTNPATYTVTLSNAECSVSAELVLSVLPAPEIVIQSDYSICEGETVVITPPDTANIWLLNGQQFTDSIALPGGGQTVLEVIEPESGCGNAQVLSVSLVSLPSPILPAGSELCEGQPLVLNPQLSGSAIDVVWSTGETTTLITVSESGVYTVEAENECGFGTASTEIIVRRCDCPYFVPNAFTPDLDGLNELFYPVFDCDVRDYEFSIFNRWGERIFFSQTPGEGWNGSGRARTHWAQGEVYIWQLRFRADLPGDLIQVDQSGHVVLLR